MKDALAPMCGTETVIDGTPITISGPDRLIFIPDTVISETPAIIPGSEILICAMEMVIEKTS